MSDLPKPPKRPCGSCPYRRDVPSGIWDASEYEKLPGYDGEIVDQIMNGAAGLFMCHQRDGCLCGGWLATHGVDNLLALRMHAVHPSTYKWTTDIPCWPSGAAAAAHGVRDIENPGPDAQRLIDALTIITGEFIKESDNGS